MRFDGRPQVLQRDASENSEAHSRRGTPPLTPAPTEGRISADINTDCAAVSPFHA